MSTAYERLLAYRRGLPRTPRLERQTVRANGIAFAVHSTPPITGTPPLVAINGGMLFGHRMLWPALAPLAAARQVILFDLRGRGQSSAPPDPSRATIEDDAADVGALRRALGVREWDLIGHSWGGGIALLAAAVDRGGSRRVVTVDAVGPTSDWIPQLRAAALERLDGDQRTSLERIDERALTEPDPRIHAAQTQAIYPAWFADPSLAVRFTLPDVHSPTGAAVLARLRREGYDWRGRLSALRSPTLVLHGDADPLPIGVAHQLRSSLPRARLVVIPGAGHMPFWEAPDTFFPVVETFLSASTPSAALSDQ